MASVPPDFKELLRTLLSHGVEFVVVGGVCAVLHGAPIATSAAASSRQVPSVLTRPSTVDDRPRPAGRIGLDWLGARLRGVGDAAQRIELGGLKLRILDLPSLIRIKGETAHAKDQATLEILRQTLKERGGK